MLDHLHCEGLHVLTRGLIDYLDIIYTFRCNYWLFHRV